MDTQGWDDCWVLHYAPQQVNSVIGWFDGFDEAMQNGIVAGYAVDGAIDECFIFALEQVNSDVGWLDCFDEAIQNGVVAGYAVDGTIDGCFIFAPQQVNSDFGWLDCFEMRQGGMV